MFTYNLRFPGQVFDKETNNHYNYFRDYDPQTGRYIYRATLLACLGGVNTYSYVRTNPVSHSDQAGLQTQAVGCAIGLPFGGPIGCGVEV